jgi:hypothetical protein
MSDELFRSIFTVATAIVGVAIIAVLVSRNAKTSEVISSAGNSFARAISAATAPVTGSGGGLGFGGFSGGAGYPALSL